MRLHDLQPAPGSRTARRRVGRGIASGRGKTAGRGTKGQKSRSGVALKGFEGGQMPLHMRLPKRGFRPHRPWKLAIVNLERLETAIESGQWDKTKTVTLASLCEAGLVRRRGDGVRILAKGALSVPLNFEVAGMSAAARAAVEKLGGKVTILPLRTRSKSDEEKAAKHAEKKKAKLARQTAAQSAKAKSQEGDKKSAEGKKSDGKKPDDKKPDGKPADSTSAAAADAAADAATDKDTTPEKA